MSKISQKFHVRIDTAETQRKINDGTLTLQTVKDISSNLNQVNPRINEIYEEEFYPTDNNPSTYLNSKYYDLNGKFPGLYSRSFPSVFNFAFNVDMTTYTGTVNNTSLDFVGYDPYCSYSYNHELGFVSDASPYARGKVHETSFQFFYFAYTAEWTGYPLDGNLYMVKIKLTPIS